ncbi:hypothetical protein [Segetibacter aerophilus]|uniref:Uncharacterized protein n=1 Tax=Segetibacter aerophilus TaxID=670293 RepID=A0A512BCC4_9BACT|nr:hypothetical protein [Segetibacter aerophilus]GEO09497.1 hypothetical protein SAE01_19930 [Segetibacter aerophilus]
MNLEQYNNLPDRQKKELLIDAFKIDEHEDEISTYELFRIEDFYVEVSKSVIFKFRKILNTYALKDIPLNYAGKVAENIVERAIDKQKHFTYI